MMSRGVTEVKGVQNSALLLSSGEVIAQKRSTTTNDNLIALIKLVIALAALYAAFYFVLVGGLWLVFPTWPQWIRVILSVVNAVIFAVIIVQPPFLMRPLGESSRRLARTLRQISAE
ncbi:hypothetical protein HC928_21355 [bacterium]|nr:hypothetical protein [bacterium]